MYKVKWDEDKWNIHSSSYNSSKYGSIFSNEKNEEVKYHEQRYGSKERSISSDYMRREDSEKERKKEGDSLFEEAEESRNEKNEISEEEMQFEVATQLLAKQLFGENRNTKKIDNNKDDTKTIEDAIKNVIEEEKKIIIMDN